jgi:hypothetical protein
MLQLRVADGTSLFIEHPPHRIDLLVVGGGHRLAAQGIGLLTVFLE